MADRQHNTKPTDAELASAFRHLEPMICRLAGLTSIMNIVLDDATHFRQPGQDGVMLRLSHDQEDALMISTGDVMLAARELRDHWNAAAEGRANG